MIGESSPKLTVTTRSCVVSEVPMTDPLLAPVMVGWPPLPMSKVCADTEPAAHIASMQQKRAIVMTRDFIIV